MLTFLLIAATTLARPAAILDLAPSQFDDTHRLLDLNPVGRVQNKKFRPTENIRFSLRIAESGCRQAQPLKSGCRTMCQIVPKIGGKFRDRRQPIEIMERVKGIEPSS